MKRFDLAFAFAVSLSLHAALFIVLGGYEEAQVVFDPGVSAVTLTIMPSVASRAAQPEPQPEPPQEPPEPEPLPVPPEPLRRMLAHPRPEVIQPPEPVPEVPVEEPQAEPEPQAEAAPEPQAAEEHAAPAPQPPTETESERAEPEPARQRSVDSVDANADLHERGVTSEASAVDLTQPEYPFYSRRHGEEGTVLVSVQVLASGRHGRIEVVESSGHSRLDRAAVSALREARYRPARRAGIAVTTTKTFRFTFRLEGIEER